MDSAKIFALGLAAGLTIAIVARNKSKAQNAAPSQSAAGTKSTKNKKKNKVKAVAEAVAPEAAVKKAEQVEQAVEKSVGRQTAAPTAKQSKKTKKQQQKNPAPAKSDEASSYADVAAVEAEEPNATVDSSPSLNNDTVRQKHTAGHAVLHEALGDMRDAQVDPVPASYNSVARIPPAAAAKAQEPLSKRDEDEGWSSVGTGRSKAQNLQQQNASSTTQYSSVASKNPFSALPDDVASSNVKRLPQQQTPATSGRAATNGSARAAPAVAATPESKKQRQNAQKNQAKKDAKEQAEQERLNRLAEHRREQQREAAKQREASKRPTPHSQSASSKQPTAKASIDLNGRLVWE